LGLKSNVHITHGNIPRVACFDLGEFACWHPDGKRIIEKAGGKPILMHMLSHKSPGVKKQALQCVQKLMVENWQYLAKTTSGAQSKKK
jgi:V-type H+-transporting ATPase subunit H